MPNFKPIHIIAGKTNPLIHIGTIKYGFQTTVPNTVGSLILNIAGIIQAFPNARNLTDFARNIIKLSGIVLPTPPQNKKPTNIAS